MEIDAILCAKLALDRGIGGGLHGPASYFMKSSPVQCTDDEARQLVEAFIAGDGKSAGDGDELRGVRFRDGSHRERSVLFFSPGQHQRSAPAEQLGCKFCEEDGCIQCDETAATCVPGLYAAGNASRGMQLVIAAAAEGTLAAVAMNNALVEADAESGALAAH